MNRSQAWLAQAQKDQASGKDLAKAGHYAQACFMAQQVAEKSLKSVAYHRGYDMVKSHSLVAILKDLKINGDLEKFGKKLDLYYLTTRYPDALPDHSLPSDSFDQAQAESALEMSEAFLSAAQLEVK